MACAREVEGDPGLGGGRDHLVVADRTTGYTTALTPPWISTCRPSGNGKKASEAATLPWARSPPG